MNNDEVVKSEKISIFEGIGENKLLNVTGWHIKMFLYFMTLLLFIFAGLYFYDKYLAPRNTAM